MPATASSSSSRWQRAPRHGLRARHQRVVHRDLSPQLLDVRAVPAVRSLHDGRAPHDHSGRVGCTTPRASRVLRLASGVPLGNAELVLTWRGVGVGYRARVSRLPSLSHASRSTSAGSGTRSSCSTCSAGRRSPPSRTRSSFGERTTSWEENFEKIAEHPLGAGVGRSGAASEKAVELDVSGAAFQPDNYYFKTAYQRVLGLWVFVVFLVAVFCFLNVGRGAWAPARRPIPRWRRGVRPGRRDRERGGDVFRDLSNGRVLLGPAGGRDVDDHGEQAKAGTRTAGRARPSHSKQGLRAEPSTALDAVEPLAASDPRWSGAAAAFSLAEHLDDHRGWDVGALTLGVEADGVVASVRPWPYRLEEYEAHSRATRAVLPMPSTSTAPVRGDVRLRSKGSSLTSCTRTRSPDSRRWR